MRGGPRVLIGAPLVPWVSATDHGLHDETRGVPVREALSQVHRPVLYSQGGELVPYGGFVETVHAGGEVGLHGKA